MLASNISNAHPCISYFNALLLKEWHHNFYFNRPTLILCVQELKLIMRTNVDFIGTWFEIDNGTKFYVFDILSMFRCKSERIANCMLGFYGSFVCFRVVFRLIQHPGPTVLLRFYDSTIWHQNGHVQRKQRADCCDCAEDCDAEHPFGYFPMFLFLPLHYV